MHNFFTSLILAGAFIGVIILNAAMALGLFGSARENKGLGEVSRNLYLCGVIVLSLSIAFAMVI